MSLTNFKDKDKQITVSLQMYSFIYKSISEINSRFSGVIHMRNNIGKGMTIIKCEDAEKTYVTYDCHYDKEDFCDNKVTGDVILFFRRIKSTTDFDLKDCVKHFLKNNKTNEFLVHGIIVSDNKTNSILCYKVIDNNYDFIVDDSPCMLNIELMDVSNDMKIIKEKLGIVKNKDESSVSTTQQKTFSINDKEKEIIDKGVEHMV